jgi:hypothetical protein
MNLEDLRELIQSRWYGRHQVLAELAGCSRRTILRLLHEPEYQPGYETFVALRDAARDWRRKR